ncbi:MAG: radical SAM protein [Candidatus Saganbacteria bacterium]|nr:radical SAM protein [Candidatus Saganbacteria bacterium]
MAIKLANKKEKKRFLKTLYERSRENRHPHSIMFELTYKCNFCCPHCYLPGGHQAKKELSTKQVFSILDQLRQMGVYHIGFTGGEALLRKDIFEILGYASCSGFRVGLLTNGYLIDEKAASKLKKIGVDRVDITFNAMSPKIFDTLTGVKGSFDKVKKAVHFLKKKKVDFVLKSTTMNINKEEIPLVSKFARELGVIYTIDGEILPCRDHNEQWVEQFSIAAEEHERLRRIVHPEMFTGNRPASKSHKVRGKMFNCGVGVNSFSITPYGQMNFCLEIGYPKHDILKEGVRSCWEKIKKEVDAMNRRKDFVCKDCDLFELCGWCPGRSYIEGNGFNACSEFFKHRAEERKAKERRKKWLKEKF